jgi:carbon monoxide dehydrogenase subunit G
VEKGIFLFSHMGVSRYVSDIKIIQNNQQVIYNYLSNFENLSKYINDGILEKMSEQIPQIKISNFESDVDSCRFQISGMGQAEIRIIEREPVKTIKISSSGGLPVSIVFWIQLMPVETYQTKIRLVLDADMSMMIKMMVNKKLEEGINRLADMLAALPYT